MCDEKPVSLSHKKKKYAKNDKTDIDRQCILCLKERTGLNVSPFTDVSSTKVHNAAIIRARDGETVIEKQEDVHIPDVIDYDKFGYHRTPCYRDYCNTKSIERKAEKRKCSEEMYDVARKPKRRTSTATPTLFRQDECIICQKNAVWNSKIRSPVHKLKKVLYEETASAILNIAKENKNEKPEIYALVNGADLRAKEARYHHLCYLNFTQKERTILYEPKDIKAQQCLKAHEATFLHIVDYVQRSIIDEMNVERMSMIRDKYLLYMHANYEEHYNANYKTDKLKEKLKNHFGAQILFWLPPNNITTSEIIYSSGRGGHKRTFFLKFKIFRWFLRPNFV